LLNTLLEELKYLDELEKLLQLKQINFYIAYSLPHQIYIISKGW